MLRFCRISTALAVLLLVAPAAGLAQTRTAVEPLRTADINYAKLPPSDPIVRQLWAAQANVRPSKTLQPSAYVTYIREPSGALLTVTMLSAAEECGTQYCPFKILRDGKVIKEFSGCNETAGHRITLDGKYLMVCDAKVAIPQ